jgi:hypothetical protein
MRQTILLEMLLVFFGLSSCVTTISPGSFQLPQNVNCAIGPGLAAEWGKAFNAQLTLDVRIKVLPELELGSSFAAFLVYYEIKPYIVYYQKIDAINSLSPFVILPIRWGYVGDCENCKVNRFDVTLGASYDYRLSPDNAISLSGAYEQNIASKGIWEDLEIGRGFPYSLSIANATDINSSLGSLVWVNQIMLYHFDLLSMATGIFIPVF